MARKQSGFTLMEMMAVIAIMAILAAMAIPSYLDRIVRQQIEAALPLADIAKKSVSDWRTFNQAFPPDNATALLPAPEKIVNNFIDSITVKDGAVHVHFGNRANGAIMGKTLSLRPAVVPDTPMVPIEWVCGMAEAPQKMVVYGENLSNVPEIFLPLNCRALKRG